MNKILLLAFALGSLFDLLMAVLGLAVIFQAHSSLGYFACFSFAFAMLCLRLSMHTLSSQRNLVSFFLRLFLFFSVFLDFFAVLNSTIVHIIQRQPVFVETTAFDWHQIWQSTSSPVKIVSLAIIIFIVSSPMIVSSIISEDFYD